MAFGGSGLITGWPLVGSGLIRRASDIWADKKGGLWWECLIRGSSDIWPDKRVAFGWEWPYNKVTIIIYILTSLLHEREKNL